MVVGGGNLDGAQGTWILVHRFNPHHICLQRNWEGRVDEVHCVDRWMNVWMLV